MFVHKKNKTLTSLVRGCGTRRKGAEGRKGTEGSEGKGSEGDCKLAVHDYLLLYGKCRLCLFNNIFKLLKLRIIIIRSQFIVDFVASIYAYSIRLLLIQIYMKYLLFVSTLKLQISGSLQTSLCPLPPPPKEVGSIRSRSKM